MEGVEEAECAEEGAEVGQTADTAAMERLTEEDEEAADEEERKRGEGEGAAPLTAGRCGCGSPSFSSPSSARSDTPRSFAALGAKRCRAE